MKWASSVSEISDAETAVQDAVDTIREQLSGAEPDLVFLFASGHHRGEEERLVQSTGDAFPTCLIIGCTAQSVIGAGLEVEERPRRGDASPSVERAVARSDARRVARYARSRF
jgi:small ligand-binding sensory domain FIST